VNSNEDDDCVLYVAVTLDDSSTTKMKIAVNNYFLLCVEFMHRVTKIIWMHK